MLVWIIVIIAGVGLDQLTKILVMNGFELNETRTVIPGLFNFHYIRNEGAAWGILSEQRWIFIVITIIAVLVLPYFLYKFRKSHILFDLSLSLIISGAVGNLIDRIFLGSVTDFIETAFMNFPIFNVADSFVTIGAIMFLVYIIFFDKTILVDRKKQKTEEKTEEKADDNNGSAG